MVFSKMSNYSLHTTVNDAAIDHVCLQETFTVHEPTTLLPVCEDLSPCSVMTQVNTIYTARLLTDIVYYIYFSYRNNVFERWY